jgi:hypothetical protein
LQNHPTTPSTRPSMTNLKTIVHNYNVFQVHYIVQRQSIAWLQSGELQKSYRRTDIKCLSNERQNLITLKDQTKKMYQSSREICLPKSGENWRLGVGGRFCNLQFLNNALNGLKRNLYNRHDIHCTCAPCFFRSFH